MATIQQVYIALFGRPADPGGLAFFQDRTSNGANLTPILGAFENSEEFQGRFEGMSDAQIVNQIYLDLFNRPAEDAGLEFFVALWNSGERSIAEIAVSILDGAQGADAEAVSNKTAYANAFTASLDTPAEIAAYNGDTAVIAQNFLSGIGADDDQVDQALVNQAIQAVVDGDVADNVITLTNQSGEAIVGGAEADTINAVVGGDNATVNTFDTIDGAAGQDTLNLVVQVSDDDVADPIDPQIRNVETIVARFVENGAQVSLANATGVETLAASQSTTFGSYADVGSVDRFSVSNQGSVGFAGATAASLELTLTNVADPDFSASNLDLATIDFDDIEATSLTVNAIDAAAALGIANISGGVQGEDTVEAITINSTGTSGANVLGISGTTALGSLTITGSQDLTLVGGSVNDGAMPTDGINAATEFTADGFVALETITATSFTGALTIDASNSLEDLSARAGSGDDTISTGAGDDLLVGGAGADTLSGGAGDNIYGGGGGSDTINLLGGGNDEVHFDAGTGFDTINDFDVAGGGIDVISFLDGGAIDFANSTDNMTRGDSDLDTADFQVRGSVTATTTADDQKVVLLAGDFTTSQLTGGIGAAAAFYLVAQNDDTGNAEIFYDDDWSDIAGRQQIASLVGVDANDLGLSNFDVYI